MSRVASRSVIAIYLLLTDKDGKPAGIATRGVSEENRLALRTPADSLPDMSNPRIFRYVKTSPEIIRLAVMMYVRYPTVIAERRGPSA